MNPALAAEGLGLSHATRHGPVLALRDIRFAIARGEQCAVVGRSGSGKTSLGRLLAGLPPPGALATGFLLWPGGSAPVARARRAGLGRQVAWLPQEAQAALHPQLTLGTQVAETLRAVGAPADARAVARALAEAELDPALAARHPHALSGGQAQRGALACALAQSPGVLVADEPTSALDTATGAAILRLLAARARERGMALILITHDLAAATDCDRILVLEEGRIVEDALPWQIRHTPCSTAARALLAAQCCTLAA